MTERSPITALKRRVAGSNITPVPEMEIRFSMGQNDESAENIRTRALSFSARELLELHEESIFDLSKEIAGVFRKVAVKYNITPDEEDMKMFYKGPSNGLIHELAHLKVISHLRPEVVDHATVNILPVLMSDGQLKVAMNVMIPAPEVLYTSYEKCQIQMAPRRPSDQDYADLYQYLMSNGVKDVQELKHIISVVRSKPESTGRHNFLSRISI